jgi:5-methylcytosine-specific restriction enzyme A
VPRAPGEHAGASGSAPYGIETSVASLLLGEFRGPIKKIPEVLARSHTSWLLEDVGLSDTGIAALTGEDLSPESPVEEIYRRLCGITDRYRERRTGRRVTRTMDVLLRSAKARRAVLIRSAGKCENPRCTGQAQDLTDSGDPILEVDHIRDLALGGADDPAQMIALCPNCHAIKTRGRTREQLRELLLTTAEQRHDALLS